MVRVLEAAPNRRRWPLSQQPFRVSGEEVTPLARQVFVATDEVFISDQAAVKATLVAELGVLAVDNTDVIRHELRLGKLREEASRRLPVALPAAMCCRRTDRSKLMVSSGHFI